MFWLFYGRSLVFILAVCVEQDILAVMTDRLHKSGFKMHATLLKHMFQLVEGGQITLELYDVAQHPNVSVKILDFVFVFLSDSLIRLGCSLSFRAPSSTRFSLERLRFTLLVLGLLMFILCCIYSETESEML